MVLSFHMVNQVSEMTSYNSQTYLVFDESIINNIENVRRK